jgi:hypothetical protein
VVQYIIREDAEKRLNGGLLNSWSKLQAVRLITAYKITVVKFESEICVALQLRWGLICVNRGADKSLAQPTSLFILFDGENISFDASLFIYTNSTNIPPIMIINRIYETQNLLSL